MSQPPEDPSQENRPPEYPAPGGAPSVPPAGPPPPPPPAAAAPAYPSYPQNPPPYGQPQWNPTSQGYQSPPPGGTNGFAIASLVFGIIGGCFLGVIFGIIALVKIGRTGQKGRGLAIAGIVLSALWLIGIVVAGIIGAVQDADRNSTGTITDGGKVNTADLQVGDCLNDLKTGTDVLDVPAVACTDPHEGEVYAVVQFTGTDFPGDAALTKQAQQRCLGQLRSVAPEIVKDRSYDIFWFQPTDFTWARGDRDLACVALTEDKRTGSILD